MFFADNIPERGEEGREAPVADGQAGRKDHKREGQGGGRSKVKKMYFFCVKLWFSCKSSFLLRFLN